MTPILVKRLPKVLREIRDFRIPLVITVLVFMVLSFWIWRVSQGGEQHLLEKEKHRAAEFSQMLEKGFLTLLLNGYWKPNEIEKGLMDILDAAKYEFIMLVQKNKTILRVGDAPEHLKLPDVEGGYLMDDMFVFSRKIRLPEAEKKTFWSRLFSGETGGAEIPSRDQWLILGKKVRNGKTYKSVFEHLFVPSAFVFLLLFVSSAAWIMTIRTRLLSEQLDAERARLAHLENLGLAAAGLAHETKNPLGIISGIAQQIAHDRELSEKNREMIEAIIDEVDKSSSRLGNFMTFAKKRELDIAPVDIRALIGKIAGIMQPEFENAGISLDINCSPQVIFADADMVRQILVNLLLNSLQASPPGSAVTIRVKPQGDGVSIIVADQGSGIAPDILPDIFKPYVTGHPAGHGLGLAIVKRFSEDHGWTVAAESGPGQGTVIKISGISISGKRGRQI